MARPMTQPAGWRPVMRSPSGTPGSGSQQPRTAHSDARRTGHPRHEQAACAAAAIHGQRARDHAARLAADGVEEPARQVADDAERDEQHRTAPAPPAAPTPAGPNVQRNAAWPVPRPLTVIGHLHDERARPEWRRSRRPRPRRCPAPVRGTTPAARAGPAPPARRPARPPARRGGAGRCGRPRRRRAATRRTRAPGSRPARRATKSPSGSMKMTAASARLADAAQPRAAGRRPAAPAPSERATLTTARAAGPRRRQARGPSPPTPRRRRRGRRDAQAVGAHGVAADAGGQERADEAS